MDETTKERRWVVSHMPHIEREFVLEMPADEAWEYLTDMERFSSHLPGFETYEQIDETTSEWTVKVDLSMFTRKMVFEVGIEQQEFPEGSFSLEPVDYAAEGGGSVFLEPIGPNETNVTVSLESEATGHLAAFHNQVIERALPRIVDRFIEDVQASVPPSE